MTNAYGQDIIGFIAEDVKQKYPIAANYDEDGQIEGWSTRDNTPCHAEADPGSEKRDR